MKEHPRLILTALVTTGIFGFGTSLLGGPTVIPADSSASPKTSLTTKVGAVTDTTKKPAPPPALDTMANRFFLACAACHTVGGGNLTGPDLVTAAKWPGDSLAKMIKTMEKNVGALSDSAITMYSVFVRDPGAKNRLDKELQRLLAEKMASLAPPSATEGESLLIGKRAFVNGGAACISCHRVDGRGGVFAVELNGVAEKMGTMALISAIEQSNFKVMRAAFREHPVTTQEAVHLTAYLQKVPKKITSSRLPTLILCPIGALAVIPCLVLFQFVYPYRRNVLKHRPARK